MASRLGFLAGLPVAGDRVVFFIDESQNRLDLTNERSGAKVAPAPLPATVHFGNPALARSQILVPAGNKVVAFRLLP
jgi:hypothetical protein